MAQGDSTGFWAAEEDPRYAGAEQTANPVVPQGVELEQTPSGRGAILGSLFRSPTNYQLFTGGLQELIENGSTPHQIASPIKPYSYVGSTPSQAWRSGGFFAGMQCWRPKLSAMVNTALGAANADRTPATRIEGPVQIADSFAVPMTSFYDMLPKNQVPPYNRQPGYVTMWPAAMMTYKPMGSGS
jgi:hypothetical protein